MKEAIRAFVITAILGAGALSAEETALLQPGEYQVIVRVQLPHIEDMSDATKVDNICVTAGDAGTGGLAVLSHINPLRKCPTSNVRQSGDTLTFDIVCAGSDAAVGSAKYTMRAEHFDGSIAVKMGGKNMTMIEHQSGRRIGDCK
jgi:hypothetical protein